MAWFKVDDSLAFHSKVLAAGNAAMGLWVRAGSWSAQQLEDGFVPAHVAKVLGTVDEAAALVEQGLWHEVDGGYAFHEWAERQPSKADVLARREAETERKRAAREAARQRREGSSSQGVSRAVSQRDSEGVSQRESALPDPTRPDPTRPDPSPSEKREGARGARIPEPFVVTREMRAWAASEVPGLDVDASTRRFVDYWRAETGAKAAKKDWIATWRNWLRRDHERTSSRRPSPVERGLSLVERMDSREQGAIGA